MTKKRFEVYESIRASRQFKSGEWFRSKEIAAALGHVGVNSKSIALYLSNMRDAGEVEMKNDGGGAYRVWRKLKGYTPHMLFRLGPSNEELGIPDASQGWH
jgi:hypothetical protein